MVRLTSQLILRIVRNFFLSLPQRATCKYFSRKRIVLSHFSLKLIFLRPNPLNRVL
jgi:hypothetical protein